MSSVACGGPGPSPGQEVTRALEILRPLGERVRPHGPLGAATTYRVGGTAAIRATVAGPADLELVAGALEATGMPVLVVGRGSNMLVADRGFPGLAVFLDPSAFGSIEVDGPAVRAGAAVALPTLARQSVEAGLTGLEWAVGVPGSVGGAVRMNAGGHGSDTARTLHRARLFDLTDGRTLVVDVGDLAYSYRHSSVSAEQVVLDAEFALAAGAADTGRDVIRQIVRWRREHQPGGQNAGSVFTNPPGDSAGRLVDAAGLRGHRLGTATVSPKHANFIQAEPGGSADDVYALIHFVRSEVRSRLGVDLRPEVRLIGFPVEPSSSGSGFTEVVE